MPDTLSSPGAALCSGMAAVGAWGRGRGRGPFAGLWEKNRPVIEHNTMVKYIVIYNTFLLILGLSLCSVRHARLAPISSKGCPRACQPPGPLFPTKDRSLRASPRPRFYRHYPRRPAPAPAHDTFPAWNPSVFATMLCAADRRGRTSLRLRRPCGGSASHPSLPPFRPSVPP